MMNRLHRIVGFFPLFLFMFIGCSDDPNSVGVGLLPLQDKLRVDSLETTALTSSTYRSPVTGNSYTLLLGKYSPLEAGTMLQFTGFPTNKTSATIDSAVLSFTITYRFKDSSGVLGLEVHRILRPWSETTITWDSLSSVNLFSQTVDTNHLFSITPGDSVLRIRIDPIVRKWFQGGISDPDGIIIIPSQISGSSIVLGLSNYSDYSTDLRPELTVGYHDASDTTTFTLRPAQRVSLANCPQPTPSTLLYLQAGVAYRGRLFFDVSSLPKNASVTSAAFDLLIDTTLSLHTPQTHSYIVAHFALDSTQNPTLSGITALSQSNDSTGTALRFDIRSIVQNWVAGYPNYGLILQALGESLPSGTLGESFTLDRFACFDAYASRLLRPRIKITYTILP